VNLVYPHEAAEPNFVSVTSGLGAALLGLKPEETFEWRGADQRMRAIRILEVEPPLRPRIVRPGS
jgi:transcription elongation GreA/GreB family factor